MSVTTENREQAASSKPAFDVFGVQLQFLIAPVQTNGEISLFQGTLPPGVVVPIHSHAEPEVFYVLEGNLEIYQEGGAQPGWSTVRSGEVHAVSGNVKHALRNTLLTPATTLLVTQDQLYAFFREVAKPDLNQSAMPPSPQELQHLFTAAAKHFYWMGSPEENAAIGIHLG